MTQPKTRMFATGRARFVAMAALALSGAALAAHQAGAAGQSPAPPAPPAVVLAQAAQQPPAIPVTLPHVQQVSEAFEVEGNAAAVNRVNLVARVPGYLEQLHFQDGAFVRRGDLLFTVQQAQYRAALQQAEAQLQLQRAALARAQTEVVRFTALAQRSAASAVEVDNWTFQRAAAEANILAAQASVELARLNLSYTEVRAPFDGQMGRHLINPGNVVGTSPQDAVLGEIMQLDPIYVQVNLGAERALQVRANLDQRRMTLEELQRITIEVGLQNETGFPHRGTLNYVAPAIDAATGTLFVRALLRNEDRTFLPGMFVRVRLPAGRTMENALMVPDRALQEDQVGRFLLIVDQNDTVQQRHVQVGPVAGGMRVITSGLQRTDRVVVGELWRATPGSRVRPQLQTNAH